MGCNGIWAQKELFSRLGCIISCNVQLDENHKVSLFKPRDIRKSDRPISVIICPQCSVAMRQFNYAYDSNIFLDKCPQCEGIWADAGEMIQVAKHLKFDKDERIIAEVLAENPYLRQYKEDEQKITKVLEIVLCVIKAFA
jgi:Zn-finger nucleic acid-binding protein